MESISVASILISLLGIAWEDYRRRRVRWFYFPLLALAGLWLGLSALQSPRLALGYAACNLGFIGLQLLILKAWYFLRLGPGVPLLGNKLGAGDILFLAAACFFFSPLNFIAFYLCSLLFSLLGWTALRSARMTVLPTVPLAGLQAIFLLLSMGVAAYRGYSLFQDDWLIAKITLL